MKKQRKSLLALAAVVCSVALTAAACGGSNDSTKVGAPSNPGSIQGFEPAKGSVPDFGCNDESYANARKNGIKLGIVSAPPYTEPEPGGGAPRGIDIDIWKAVLQYIGVEKVSYVTAGWDSFVPALTSGRIDVVAANFHETPERLAKIAFTSPSWWYAPVILVKKGNPKGIKSFEDLANGQTSVAVSQGSAASLYLDHIKAESVTYTDLNLEFSAVISGRQTAALEDSPHVSAYLKAHPDAGLEEIPATPPAELLSNYGYGYARYGVRQGDCTLNAAASRALAELRDAGVVGKILKSYGLNNNVVIPTADHL